MRLIDADVVLKVIKAYQNFPYGNLGIVEQINKIPTAYDKEKVVEQIVNESYGMDLDESDYVIERDRAVEIVKAGGANEIN